MTEEEREGVVLGVTSPLRLSVPVPVGVLVLLFVGVGVPVGLPVVLGVTVLDGVGVREEGITDTETS